MNELDIISYLSINIADVVGLTDPLGFDLLFCKSYSIILFD